MELKYDGDKGSLAQLIDNISDSLSRGCAVLVRGWKPNNPPLDFTCEDIRFFRPTISQEVVVQGMDIIVSLKFISLKVIRCIKACRAAGGKGGARHEQSF